MANPKVDAAIRRARRASKLDTDAAIVANDGVTPYPRPGHIRVQVKHGSDYLPAITVINGLNFAPNAGTPVRLGLIRGKDAVVEADLDAIRAAGADPLIVQRQESNVNYTSPTHIPIMKVSPQNPPSTSLVVAPAWVETPAGLEFHPTEEVSLSTEIGALSSGEQQLIGLFLRRDLTVEVVTSTAINSADPVGIPQIEECYAGRTPGSRLIGFWVIADGMTEITGAAEFLDARQFISIPPVVFSTADISTPPTDTELDSEFGTPADVGEGFLAIVDDNGADTSMYLVGSNGTSWWYIAWTKAT